MIAIRDHTWVFLYFGVRIFHLLMHILCTHLGHWIHNYFVYFLTPH
jgi:putative Ca2+/H+ antiporter (TMEM165/GDT1 family)